MTRRAARMLAALEDGCTTRQEIHAHAGVFFLTNNAASDLRRAGIEVAWDRTTDTYCLLDDGRRDNGAGSTVPHGIPVAPIVERASGQFSFEVSA